MMPKCKECSEFKPGKAKGTVKHPEKGGSCVYQGYTDADSGVCGFFDAKQTKESGL
jgi:hypothetical protein